jgi:cyanophycin synthetase
VAYYQVIFFFLKEKSPQTNFTTLKLLRNYFKSVVKMLAQLFLKYCYKIRFMKVLETKVMKGPSYWSNYHKKLIVVKLDLEELEYKPTNELQGFAESLQNHLPSLCSHRCSKNYEGGFFERVREGTWIGHVIEHVALELQCLAGMECGFGRTRMADELGVYNIVISYTIEQAGLYAVEAAIRLAETLISGENYNLLEDIQTLITLKAKYSYGPSTQSIINEAIKRKIPCKGMEDGSLIMLGYGTNQRLIRASMTSATSNLGVERAKNKEDTKRLLIKSYVPVPAGKIVSTVEEVESVVAQIGFPLVVKPIDGNHGRGITTNISHLEHALSAYGIAKQVSGEVIIEKFISGEDYRILVINNKFVAAARRTPAMVMGDGESTIAELIERVNSDSERGEGHEKTLTKIKVDQITENILYAKRLNLISVLPLGEILFLKHTANLSSGGTSTDVTDLVHPVNIFIAERVSRLMKLDICGIDIVAADISQPINGKNGAVIEVNACPGFRMHLSPSKGIPRNVAEPVLDMLFPEGTPSRIPIVAVTGTNGKTTTTRLTAHLAKVAGHKVGYTTTDGIYIMDHELCYGDCTGIKSTETVLSDPTVNFAVLECARGGILKSGLGFDHCNISIITNVSDDHLGLKGINTLADMARVKEVVARSTFDHGYSILNADDEFVYNMRDELNCNIALFSINPSNTRIRKHCSAGGLAATVEKGYLTICKGEWKVRVCRVESIPLTFDGRAECMIKNVMPAVLAAIICNFRIEDIRAALQTFTPSPECTPGRMNIFKFRNFEFMIDYAHNAAGYSELKIFMDKVRSPHKIGIITGVGDRRDEDIINLGKLAAQIFDEIVIKHDDDLRGRSASEITDLLVKGIHLFKSDPIVAVVSREPEAIQYAIDHAKKGSFIVLCADHVRKSIELVKQKQALETEFLSELNSVE